MGCKFCATGSMGFKSNLSSGEIVEQLVHASHFSQIRNVVFMVMTFFFLLLSCVCVDLGVLRGEGCEIINLFSALIFDSVSHMK